jgi:hypothetical protein
LRGNAEAWDTPCWQKASAEGVQPRFYCIQLKAGAGHWFRACSKSLPRTFQPGTTCYIRKSKLCLAWSQYLFWEVGEKTYSINNRRFSLENGLELRFLIG